VYDLGELLYGFLVRFGEEFDTSRVRLGMGGFDAATTRNMQPIAQAAAADIGSRELLPACSVVAAGLGLRGRSSCFMVIAFVA
jgi:hypothetical protein